MHQKMLEFYPNLNINSGILQDSDSLQQCNARTGKLFSIFLIALALTFATCILHCSRDEKRISVSMQISLFR